MFRLPGTRDRVHICISSPSLFSRRQERGRCNCFIVILWFTSTSCGEGAFPGIQRAVWVQPLLPGEVTYRSGLFVVCSCLWKPQLRRITPPEGRQRRSAGSVPDTFPHGPHPRRASAFPASGFTEATDRVGDIYKHVVLRGQGLKKRMASSHVFLLYPRYSAST